MFLLDHQRMAGDDRKVQVSVETITAHDGSAGVHVSGPNSRINIGAPGARTRAEQQENRVLVLVDSVDLVRQLLDLEISPGHIARQLSSAAIGDLVRSHVAPDQGTLNARITVEFVSPGRLFGALGSQFSWGLWKEMLDRVGHAANTFVDVVGDSVDELRSHIDRRIEFSLGREGTIALVSSDGHYSAALTNARHEVQTATLNVGKNPRNPLSSKSHLQVSAGTAATGVFEYAYPHYSIDGFDTEKCAVLYAEADDRNHNTLAVTRSGMVHMIRNPDLDDMRHEKFRFEGFVAGNNYVGPQAASDDSYIENQTANIIMCWTRGMTGYIDWFPAG